MIFQGLNEYYIQDSEKLVTAGELPPFNYSPIILEGKGTIFQVAHKWVEQETVIYEIVRLSDYLRVIFTQQNLDKDFTKIINICSIKKIQQEANKHFENDEQTILQVIDA